MLFWARVTQSKVWRKTTTHTSTKSIQLYIMHWLVLKWYVLCICMYVMLREVDWDYFVTEHDMHVVAFISLSNIICGVDKIFDTRYMTCFFSAPYRFLLHLSCQSPVLEGPANFSVVETNAFKHLNHLSLRLAQGSDKEVKDYLAVCLSSLKVGSFRIPHHNTVWLLNCTTQELLYLLFYYLSGNPKKQTHRLGEEMSCNINRYANFPMENVGSTDLPESSSFSQSILSKHSFPK